MPFILYNQTSSLCNAKCTEKTMEKTSGLVAITCLELYVDSNLSVIDEMTLYLGTRISQRALCGMIGWHDDLVYYTKMSFQ